MTNFSTYYQKNHTYLPYIDTRLRKIIQLIQDLKPKKILDIGCGNGLLLNELRKFHKAYYYGVDVYSNSKAFYKYKKGDITKKVPFRDNQFDCVILGEVIEHVPNPDFVLTEINRILKKNGYLIISTPNLVSWANRILVLFGIQPFFTETSSYRKLGRYFSFLGQNTEAQGHLKIFTNKSLDEILEMYKFTVKGRFGVPFFFPFPLSLIDGFFTKFISFSSGLLYLTQKKSTARRA